MKREDVLGLLHHADIVENIHGRSLAGGPMATVSTDQLRALCERWLAVESECEWVHDFDSEAWDSACGEKWTFMDGGPEDNNVRFCHGCGKRTRINLEPADES